MNGDKKVFRELSAWVAVIVVCESLALFMPGHETFLRFALMLAGAGALWKLMSRMIEIATGKTRKVTVESDDGWAHTQTPARA
jgi:hypothetical protein